MVRGMGTKKGGFEWLRGTWVVFSVSKRGEKKLWEAEIKSRDRVDVLTKGFWL